MDIQKSTKGYEHWLAEQIDVVQADLDFKHARMAADPFEFFRATYYRWAQIYGKRGNNGAPEVLAVGDLHVENFGTWRDLEGRLVWGINDFDEATDLPYDNDLVRLACSVSLANDACAMQITIEEACQQILAGYEKSLRNGGKPFLLAGEHPHLRKMATGALRDPQHFWQKMDLLPKSDQKTPQELVSSLPHGSSSPEMVSRRAGLGSLGRTRLVALADWNGGRIAREAKAALPSAALWAADKKGEIRYQEILDHSRRCLDPYVKLDGPWILRRLAPDCSRIELSQIPAEREEDKLLEAMGFEAGNVHLGSPKAISHILDDLAKQPKKWLTKAAKEMKDKVLSDFDDWREDFRP